jgi:predicted short-subunit dehydrogenase-like oxidoreductase (DUF2520 family)
VTDAPAGAGEDRVFVLGAGRAGRGLTRALRTAGVTVAGLHGRRADAAAADPVTAGPLPASLGSATIVLVAVQDAALDVALDELLAGPLSPHAVVLQASGSAEPRRLEEARRRGHAAGTFHPLVPLADPARAPELLRGGWVGLDGDDAAIAAGRRLAAALGASTLVIPPGQKPRYHAAAVFASNFPTVLAAIAERLMREAGVESESGTAAVRALLAAAAANVARGDTRAALTGPVVRGDAVTIGRHLEALASDEEAREVYLCLSRAALALRGGEPDRQMAAMLRGDDEDRRTGSGTAHP